MLSGLLLHGTLGWWDEIVCILPTLLLAGLIIYIVIMERRAGRAD